MKDVPCNKRGGGGARRDGAGAPYDPRAAPHDCAPRVRILLQDLYKPRRGADHQRFVVLVITLRTRRAAGAGNNPLAAASASEAGV